MSSYIARRCLITIPLLFAVGTLVFILIRMMPGDPVMVMLAGSGGSAEAIARIRGELGLDLPMWQQYGKFVFDAVRGNLGLSLFEGRPVVTVISDQIGRTAELAAASSVLAIALGTVLGVLSAVNAGKWLDSLFMTLAVFGLSLPSFWFGLVLILVFSFGLGWLPATGAGGIKHLILPGVALGLICSAMVARLVRSSMLEVLKQDYITTARSKGLAERVILYKHALRNAMIPVVTMIGLQFGWLLGGTVVIETVFARPGLGRLTVNAILWQDFPLAQGCVLVSAAVYLMVNLVVDILYSTIDPRIRVG